MAPLTAINGAADAVVSPEPNEHTDKSGGVPFAVTLLAVLAVLYTLFAARAFLVPIAYALLLNQLLSSQRLLLPR